MVSGLRTGRQGYQRLRNASYPIEVGASSDGAMRLSAALQVGAARTLALQPVSHRLLSAHAQQSTIAEGPEQISWNRFVFAPMTAPVRSRLFATCHGRKFRGRRH